MKNLLVISGLSKNNPKRNLKIAACLNSGVSSNIKNQRQISIHETGNFCIRTIFHEHKRQSMPDLHLSCPGVKFNRG